MFFGCFTICVLSSPSGECFSTNIDHPLVIEFHISGCLTGNRFFYQWALHYRTPCHMFAVQVPLALKFLLLFCYFLQLRLLFVVMRLIQFNIYFNHHLHITYVFRIQIFALAYVRIADHYSHWQIPRGRRGPSPVVPKVFWIWSLLTLNLLIFWILI